MAKHHELPSRASLRALTADERADANGLDVIIMIRATVINNPETEDDVAILALNQQDIDSFGFPETIDIDLDQLSVIA